MNILKEEINSNGREILSLSKWKMTMVAAVAIVGLGWKDFKPNGDAGLMLACSVGYFCAYIDWFVYKKYISLHSISMFLMKYASSDPEFKMIQSYEKMMSYQRTKGHFFLSDKWPHLLSSLAATFGLWFLSHLQVDDSINAASNAASKIGENSTFIMNGLAGSSICLIISLFGICFWNKIQLDKEITSDIPKAIISDDIQ